MTSRIGLVDFGKTLEAFFTRLGLAYGNPAGLSAEKSARLNAVRISTILGMTPYMMAGNAVAAAVLVAVFLDVASPYFLLPWAGLFAAFIGIAMRQWWQARHRPAPSRASDRTIKRVTLSCIIPAVLWGIVPIILFPEGSFVGKLLIASIVLGTLCAGAFGLSTIAQAAYLYTGIITVSALAALYRDGELFNAASALLLITYMIITWVSISWFYTLFNSNVIRAMEIEEQKELVGLLLHDFQENASDWLWEVDSALRLTMISPRLAERLGISEARLYGRPLPALMRALKRGRHSVNAPDLAALARDILSKRASFAGIEIPVVIGGEEIWWSITGKPVFSDRGEFAGFRGVGSDVTATKRSQEKMRHMAHHDALTDLPNRALLQSTLEKLLAGKAELALLLLDLDHFKTINDTMGHLAGDAVLVEVANRLRAVVPKTHLIARIGGDEFVVLQPIVAEEFEAEQLAGRIVAAMAEPFVIRDRKMHVGGSIGVAVSPIHGTTGADLFRRADLALYAAKAQGRGGHCFFEFEMESSARARRAIEDDLRIAAAEHKLEMEYQPIVELASGRIIGAEALMRWDHPIRGYISPSQFIPIAEETGLIDKLGAWALHSACEAAATWPKFVSVAVNVSAAQMRGAQLPAHVVAALAKSRLTPARLSIEITESVLASSADAQNVVGQLHALGVRLALDDFGTGYSSLSYLRLFPFDKIKIDRSFVRDAVKDPGCVAIVNAVSLLASQLGIATVAEGIETEAELDIVRAAGCRLGQGFLYGRSMSAAEFFKLIWEQHDRETGNAEIAANSRIDFGDRQSRRLKAG